MCPPRQNINYKASNFLWAIFAAMLFVDLLMLAWCFTLPKGRRTFHYLSVFILTTASIVSLYPVSPVHFPHDLTSIHARSQSYFSMASDLGATPVYVEFNDIGYTRQIWYVRYIDWIITTPCLLLELVLATGLPLSDIIALIFFDIVMIVTGLVGGLVVSSYKWGYFAFGCAALVYIWFILLWPAMRSVTLLGPGKSNEAHLVMSSRRRSSSHASLASLTFRLQARLRHLGRFPLLCLDLLPHRLGSR